MPPNLDECPGWGHFMKFKTAGSQSAEQVLFLTWNVPSSNLVVNVKGDTVFYQPIHSECPLPDLLRSETSSSLRPRIAEYLKA